MYAALNARPTRENSQFSLYGVHKIRAVDRC